MRKRKILSYLLSLTLVMTSMPTQLFATQVDTQSNETYIDLEQQATTQSIIKVHQPQEYSGDGYKVSFEVTDQWTGAFNANMTILNTGKEALENWTLSFDFDHEITNIWGAQIVSHEGNTYVIKNATYNQDIVVGDRVSVGFSAMGDEIKAPSSFEMLIQKEQVANKDYTIGFKVTSDWGSAFNGEISIKNNTEKDIEDWILEFDYDRNITSFWTASIEKHEGNHYVVKNAGYNANIKAGETLTLGFAGTPGDVNNEPENYILTQIGQEIDYEKDTDEDGIPDYFEKILGTNPNNTDSDGDGLSDGYEYFYLETDPALKDTDGNGIDDGEEDFDSDGLNNLEEYNEETDPYDADTDGDDLNDGDEVHTYGTSPLKIDTDSDGLIDGDDVTLGFDPLKVDTNDNGIIDSQEKVQQIYTEEINNEDRLGVESVAVKVKCAGNLKKEVQIKDVYGQDILSSNVVGGIGAPVSIELDAEFEEADVIFKYDENALGDTKEENLAVMWYDMENGTYQIFDKDSVIDMENNTITYTTTHFSTYLLVDRQQWYNAWKYNIDYTRTETSKLFYDIGLIVDVSGSMWGTKLNNTKAGLKGFVENMYEGDDACLVTFDDKAYLVSDFGSTKEELTEGISSLVDLWGTNVYEGLSLGINKLVSKSSPNSKIAILICDGDVNNVDSLIEKAKDEAVKIYTINIEYASSHTYLERIANETGGRYYYATTADELTDILLAIQCQTITGIDTTDTDGDGLYDIIEKKGVRIQNGQIIKTDPTIPDTDGDGLIDSEEIIFDGAMKEYKFTQFDQDNFLSNSIVYNKKIEANNQTTSQYCSAYSNPNAKNTDNDEDGLEDNCDPLPWNKINNGERMNLTSAQLEIVQRYLVELGFLNMEGNPYGNSYSTLTKTAVNIYQLNRGFELHDYIDTMTYDTIINEYINRFNSSGLSNKIQYTLTDPSVTSKKKYFNTIPLVKPKLSFDYAFQGIKVVETDNSGIKDDSGVGRKIYLYDYTEPINKLLYENDKNVCQRHRYQQISKKVAWFVSYVKAGGCWDIKLHSSWANQLPYIEQYTQRFPFIFRGKQENPETLGNITYAYWGRCAGFSLFDLQSGGQVASIMDTGKFEGEQDQQKIKLGNSYYEEDH